MWHNLSMCVHCTLYNVQYIERRSSVVDRAVKWVASPRAGHEEDLPFVHNVERDIVYTRRDIL